MMILKVIQGHLNEFFLHFLAIYNCGSLCILQPDHCMGGTF